MTDKELMDLIGIDSEDESLDEGPEFDYTQEDDGECAREILELASLMHNEGYMRASDALAMGRWLSSKFRME